MYARWRFTSAIDTLILILMHCSADACIARTQVQACTKVKVMVYDAPQKQLSRSSGDRYSM